LLCSILEPEAHESLSHIIEFRPEGGEGKKKKKKKGIEEYNGEVKPQTELLTSTKKRGKSESSDSEERITKVRFKDEPAISPVPPRLKANPSVR